LSLSSLSHQKEYELFLKNSFRKADANNSGYLSIKEVGCPPTSLCSAVSYQDVFTLVLGGLETGFWIQGANPPPPLNAATAGRST
jgi:hypothetical protein